MVIFLSKQYDFVNDDPFVLVFDPKGLNEFEFLSFVTPFSPLSSLILHIPIRRGRVINQKFEYLLHRFVLIGFIILIA